MRRFLLTKLFCVLCISLCAQEREASAIPEWFLKSIDDMAGEWKASNAKYQAEDDPYEAFGMVWEKGVDGKSMKGTLYGFHQGEKTEPFWEFRTFWHPGDKKVYALQFGYGGVFGQGEMLPGTIDQTFFSPDGSFFRSGHRSETKNNQHIAASFTINEKGEWTPQRNYTWDKVK